MVSWLVDNVETLKAFLLWELFHHFEQSRH